MTLEELVGTNMTDNKMLSASEALEALVVAAQLQDCLTVGVYESAKLMTVDPDSVVLCVLATDEEDEGDIALQIHFTLLQAFCRDSDIHLLRVEGMRRLRELLGEPDHNGNQTRDLHCLLVTSSTCQTLSSDALGQVISYCEESLGNNQWEPCLARQQP
ncbi:hypothetical protein NHX12_016729 [Muraenolepis orangiensis]|uniref:Ribosomal protein eL8/eL30/eS12/Gadd45 domain-containing protein n=1 Tax=Muraenolepis orangiensis TaxID=630683 RepID=A0A9Q0I2N7_9TELE|nr:hypothetical protein NHX12_016729 [Muraenolepis orangiensis]